MDVGGAFPLIPARGGSKGVPRKNLRELGGVPLIVHSIRIAREVFPEVFVSTEDGEIADVARTHGAVVIDRPDELARDETAMPDVVENALHWCEANRELPRHIFLLQPTSPLRAAEDIRAAVAMLDAGGCDSVMAVFEAPDPPQWVLRSNAREFLEPAFALTDYLARRQDLPPAYLDGPLYAIETQAFREHRRFLTERTRFFVIPPERALDIDTERDFRFAEFLIADGAGI